jgi:serine/threonine protein kinase
VFLFSAQIQKMELLKREILSWPQCVKLSQYDDIPEIVDVTRLLPLGEGAFGKVFKAELTHNAYGLKIGAKVALKELDLNKMIGSVEAQDLKTEILAMAELSEKCSSNVARFYDVIYVPNDGLLYILMEFVSGKDLNRHSKWGNPDEYRVHEQMARGLVEGIKCLHQARIAHRDIKPENVLANEDLSNLKWIDMGFSCVTACKLNQDPRKVGTALFLAPEVLSGEMDGSLFSWQVADLYSLGLLLHEMCGGKLKLATSTGGAILVGGISGSKSGYVDALMRACLAEYPDERYEQWTELDSA